MFLEVNNAEYIKDYKIHLWFNNGTEKTVVLKNQFNGTVFKPLKNIELFHINYNLF